MVVRQRNHQVRAYDEAALDFAISHQVNHLCCRCPFPRQLVDRDTPDVGDVLTFFRHIDVAVAGELVSFLTNLAPALAIALSSDHHSAAPWLADLTASQ